MLQHQLKCHHAISSLSRVSTIARDFPRTSITSYPHLLPGNLGCTHTKAPQPPQPAETPPPTTVCGLLPPPHSIPVHFLSWVPLSTPVLQAAGNFTLSNFASGVNDFSFTCTFLFSSSTLPERAHTHPQIVPKGLGVKEGRRD